ncbi:unnamed protein product [Plutella xylostella]|uniref:(diamondback moth) hypothetical protein n=1 Tax=Plutella xylostella TaxID=51655 RepID=A0A8S4EJI1_PLUXY|nr:unnamed protein product [Plutella xylostella]
MGGTEMTSVSVRKKVEHGLKFKPVPNSSSCVALWQCDDLGDMEFHGYSSVIPGFPRHTMFGDRKLGVYNLRIVGATLQDAGEYQCQVNPNPN